ncbi:unnamed protein product [Urochloa decumbens]|uniref:Uncharacterized protein n=1 Tax=Urochloa decumbens TaxID=240449 RepID=A0ABC8Z6X4_9POAL
MLTSLTVTFDTHAFVLSRPSPPMLIPWPGPQFTLCIFMLLHPVWMEIQSSPALNKTNRPPYVIYFGLTVKGIWKFQVFSATVLFVYP